MFSKLDDLHKNDSAKRLADTLAEWHAKNAGGEAQLKLEQQLTAIADAKVAIAQGDTEQNERTLNSLQQQLPLLQAAAAAERLAADEATRRAASHAAFEKSLANMPHPYAAPTPKKQPDTSGLFGPQPGIQAPREFENVGPTGGDAGQALSTALTSSFGTAKGALTDFYDDWKGKQAQTADSITDSYNDQLKHFQDLLKNQAISQQQFDTVRIQLETQLQGQLKELRKNTGASTMEDAFNDMFNDVENSGRDFARSLTADIGGALNGLNEQIAKFAVTGKGLNLEKLGSSFMENMTSTVLKKGESAALGAFGLGGARDGSSAMNALFVTNADTSLSKSLSGFTGGSVGGALPAVAGGFNPLSLLSFLPGFAEGGDFDAGHSFIAGEKGPELITPRRSGTVHPNGSKIGGDTHYHAHVTFNGVTDHDSFKRNQGQLMNQITAAQARASRNS
jgi:hypothetical protein